MRPDPWELEKECSISHISFIRHCTAAGDGRTNDEGDHGGSISSGLLQSLDQFLDLEEVSVSNFVIFQPQDLAYLPNLNVLLGLVRLRGAHVERWILVG